MDILKRKSPLVDLFVLKNIHTCVYVCVSVCVCVCVCMCMVFYNVGTNTSAFRMFPIDFILFFFVDSSGKTVTILIYSTKYTKILGQ